MHCIRVLRSQKSGGGHEKKWLHYRNDYSLHFLCSPSLLLQVPAQVDLPPRRPPSGPFQESVLSCSVLCIRLHFPQSLVLYMCLLVGWLSATPIPSTGLQLTSLDSCLLSSWLCPLCLGHHWQKIDTQYLFVEKNKE